MTGDRQAAAEQTRERLIAAARKLFTEKGYHATGTSEVVDVAGVGTRGALYHHFENKEALFRAALLRVQEDLSARVVSTLTGESCLDRLRQALFGFLNGSLDPEVRRIMLLDGPAVLGWDAWREIEAQFGLGAINHFLTLGANEGSIKTVDPNTTAHLLLAAVHEAALFIAHSNNPRAARSAAGASLDALLSGLSA